MAKLLIAKPAKGNSLVNRGLYFSFFLGTSLLVAFGQPDRHPIFCLLTYLFGYSGGFYLLSQVKVKKSRFILAFLWFALVSLWQLSWLAATHYHGLLILSIYFLVVFLFAIQFAFVSLLFSSDSRLQIGRGLAIASLWSILEWSRLYYLCGFPFNPVGLVMTFSIYPLQWASLFGVYGLSFWVFFTSYMGAIASRKRSILGLFLWALLLFVPFGFGGAQLYLHKEMNLQPKELSVVLVQTGLKEEEKWHFPEQEHKCIQPVEQWAKIFQYVGAHAAEKIDLIVLPEVAVPGEAYGYLIPFDAVGEKVIRKKERLPPLAAPFARKNADNKWFVSNAYMAQALSNLYGSEVVIGLLEHVSEKQVQYNSAFHFMPFQQKGTRYDKRVLVPLSEYMPLPFFRSFVARYGITTFFTHGESALVFQGLVPLSASVCYEEGYNGLIREGRLQGAELFVNITNDGWFPFSRLSREHFHLGRLRAIENGIPVIRACNTGVTSAIDSFGNVIATLDELDQNGDFFRGALLAKVPLYSWMPLFARFGNFLPLSLSLLFIAFFLFQKSAQRSALLLKKEQ